MAFVVAAAAFVAAVALEVAAVFVAAEAFPEDEVRGPAAFQEVVRGAVVPDVVEFPTWERPAAQGPLDAEYPDLGQGGATQFTVAPRWDAAQAGMCPSSDVVPALPATSIDGDPTPNVALRATTWLGGDRTDAAIPVDLAIREAPAIRAADLIPAVPSIRVGRLIPEVLSVVLDPFRDMPGASPPGEA